MSRAGQGAGGQRVNLPEGSQRVGAQEVVEADVLVSSDVHHLGKKKNHNYTNTISSYKIIFSFRVLPNSAGWLEVKTCMAAAYTCQQFLIL